MSTIHESFLTDLAHKNDLKATPTGDLDLLSGAANVQNALLHRLITVPGSLLARPDYGVGIQLFQNTLNTLATQRRLAQLIQSQFELDSRVEQVSGVLVQSNLTHPEQTTIVVRVKLKGLEELPMQFVPFGG